MIFIIYVCILNTTLVGILQIITVILLHLSMTISCDMFYTVSIDNLYLQHTYTEASLHMRQSQAINTMQAIKAAWMYIYVRIR